MPVQVKPALEQLVARLRAAGFSASVDPEELSADTACVWVQPRTLAGWRLAGGAELTVWLYLVVPNVETSHALALLDDALAGVLALDLPLSDDDTIDLAAAVVLPANPGTPLPAYRLAVDLELE
jgi:hypothetical protein